MDDHILILGFADDTSAVFDSVRTGLSAFRTKFKLHPFTGKWEMKNWLDEHACVPDNARSFRHDSRIFFNTDIFCSRSDYEQTFFWTPYHSNHIKLFIISSSTRELESNRADICYDNLDFCKQILPGVPKIYLDLSDGQWCHMKTYTLIDLVADFQESVYHVKRDISSPEKKTVSEQRLIHFIRRLIKNNYQMPLETFLELA